MRGIVITGGGWRWRRWCWRRRRRLILYSPSIPMSEKRYIKTENFDARLFLEKLSLGAPGELRGNSTSRAGGGPHLRGLGRGERSLKPADFLLFFTAANQRAGRLSSPPRYSVVLRYFGAHSLAASSVQKLHKKNFSKIKI